MTEYVFTIGGEPISFRADDHFRADVGGVETWHPRAALTIWTDGELSARDILKVEVPLPVMTLEEEREALFVRIGDYRREASQRLTFAGMSIFLDAKTEDAIHKGIKGLERSPPGTTIKFEIKPGYVTAMDLIWMEALGDAAFAWVQACFDRSAVLCEQGWAAETLEDLRAIDITTGWPT